MGFNIPMASVWIMMSAVEVHHVALWPLVTTQSDHSAVNAHVGSIGQATHLIALISTNVLRVTFYATKMQSA
jgi:hypothetical protein